MTEESKWLPPRIEFTDYDGNWFNYLEEVYRIYMQTLVWDRANFQDKIVYTFIHPMRDGKEETFWHIVEGKDKSKAETNFDRYRCVPWVRPIIDAAKDDKITWWISSRTKKGKRRKIKRLVIALNDFSYKLVLNIRKEKYLLFTAYPIPRKHEQRKLKKEYEEWQKK